MVDEDDVVVVLHVYYIRGEGGSRLSLMVMVNGYRGVLVMGKRVLRVNVKWYGRWVSNGRDLGQTDGVEIQEEVGERGNGGRGSLALSRAKVTA